MIDTPRLTLRPFTVGDFEASASVMNDPAVLIISGRSAMSSEDVWNRLLRCIGHWQAYGFGIFALIDKTDGQVVGEAGLAYFKRGLGDLFETAPECTWTLAAQAHGRGLATEAVEAVHAWMLNQHRVNRTVCLIHPDNSRSLQLARKVGYKAFDQCTYKGGPATMLERNA